MTHDPTHDAETDAIVAELEKGGLVETFTNDEGKVAYRLTPKGAQVGRSMATSGDDAAALFDALLEAGWISERSLSRSLKV
jgi:hypothetical protein